MQFHVYNNKSIEKYCITNVQREESLFSDGNWALHNSEVYNNNNNNNTGCGREEEKKIPIHTTTYSIAKKK